ncbi:hypothetical protein GOP47_0026819 [Adiantum capillus-veneris]|nr:hypothetical protein GOP47_0026819 [Adiantum capillus-veneris]
MAGLAACFYGERRALDMRCFDKVSPNLCMQIIHRFGSSQLVKCYFRCDLYHQSSPSPNILHAIVERFLDNYRCNDDLMRDLHTEFATGNADWFPVAAAPRPVDVLAHSFLLECMLSTQPAMCELILDVEFGVFRVPKSKGGYRQHWYLMQPFMALQSIQRKCPSLVRYTCGLALYQNSAVDMKHVQLRFLQNSKQLRSLSTSFELDKGSLESYRHIQGPLLLEQAAFTLPKWCALQGDSAHNQKNLRDFAEKLPHLSIVAMSFSARGALKYAGEFLRNLTTMGSLKLKCEFNPRVDIDEGEQMGGFFDGYRSILPAKVKKLAMVNVPEGEFGIVFGSDCAELQASLEHVCVRFVWSSAVELGQEKMERIEVLFKSLPHLQSLCIEGYNERGSPVFSKILSRKRSSANLSGC